MADPVETVGDAVIVDDARAQHNEAIVLRIRARAL